MSANTTNQLTRSTRLLTPTMIRCLHTFDHSVQHSKPHFDGTDTPRWNSEVINHQKIMYRTARICDPCYPRCCQSRWLYDGCVCQPVAGCCHRLDVLLTVIRSVECSFQLAANDKHGSGSVRACQSSEERASRVVTSINSTHSLISRVPQSTPYSGCGF